MNEQELNELRGCPRSGGGKGVVNWIGVYFSPTVNNALIKGLYTKRSNFY